MNSPAFKVGDIVKLITKDLKDEKVQKSPFQGVVIAKKGHGDNVTFTLRKISVGNVAVEKIYPLKSPSIVDVKVVKKGKVRRAKLYYLRHSSART